MDSIEGGHICPDRPRIKLLFKAFEELYSFDERLNTLFIKEHSCGRYRLGAYQRHSRHRIDWDQRLQCSAFSKRNNRFPACHRLKRNNTQILFAGKDQRLTASIVLSDYLIRLPAQHLHSWTSHLSQSSFILTRTDYLQME